jgi:hypothetical protein
LKRMNSRMPQMGDLLFVTCRDSVYGPSCTCEATGDKHIGYVSEIRCDRWGHQQNVLIEWSTNEPYSYREEIGYNGNNIHNLRREFTIIRDGIEIP